jgi:hypothetical protein
MVGVSKKKRNTKNRIDELLTIITSNNDLSNESTLNSSSKETIGTYTSNEIIITSALNEPRSKEIESKEPITKETLHNSTEKNTYDDSKSVFHQITYNQLNTPDQFLMRFIENIFSNEIKINNFPYEHIEEEIQLIYSILDNSINQLINSTDLSNSSLIQKSIEDEQTYNIFYNLSNELAIQINTPYEIICGRIAESVFGGVARAIKLDHQVYDAICWNALRKTIYEMLKMRLNILDPDNIFSFREIRVSYQ